VLKLTEIDEVSLSTSSQLGVSVTGHSSTRQWARTPRDLPKGVPQHVEPGRRLSEGGPTLWDVDYQMAVSQAELEDREQPGFYHRVPLPQRWPGCIEIETTRPELLASCVALVAHPDDPRFAPLFGTTVRTPLFGVDVPLVATNLPIPKKAAASPWSAPSGDTTTSPGGAS